MLGGSLLSSRLERHDGVLLTYLLTYLVVVALVAVQQRQQQQQQQQQQQRIQVVIGLQQHLVTCLQGSR